MASVNEVIGCLEQSRLMKNSPQFGVGKWTVNETMSGESISRTIEHVQRSQCESRLFLSAVVVDPTRMLSINDLLFSGHLICYISYALLKAIFRTPAHSG